jgi:2-polyprenyl-6-methoxyphenol hydroxylase-like FAD-dependent oxidoreductase
MIMWSGSGKRLGEVRNGAAPGQGDESVVVKRGSLHFLLREEAQRSGIPIIWDKRLTAVDVLPNERAIAQFSDGTVAEGDCMIGSDGIHSRIRQIINPGAVQPVYTGLLSCGGFAHSTALAPTPRTQHFIFGQHAFFGYFVKVSGEVWWFSNIAYAGEYPEFD